MSKKHRGIIAVILISAVAVTSVWAYRKFFFNKSTVNVYYGTVEAKHISISSEIPGRIKSINIQEGAAITAGFLVAVLDSGDASVNLAKSQIAVQNAQNNLGTVLDGSTQQDINAQKDLIKQAQSFVDQANAGLSQAQGNVSSAQSTYDYKQTLYNETDAKNKTLLENAKNQLNLAGNALATAQSNYDYKETLYNETDKKNKTLLANAKNQLNAAENALATAQSNYDYKESLYEQTLMNYKAGTATKDALDSAQNQLDQAENALASAESDYKYKKTLYAQAGTDARDALASARNQLDSAQNALTSAESDYNYKKTLYDQAGTDAKDALASARNQLDLAGTALNSANASVNSAKAQVNGSAAQKSASQEKLELLLKGATQREITAAKNGVDQADKDSSLAALALDKNNILASKNGTIETVNYSEGEYINPGSALATLIDPADIWVKIYVPENVLSKIRINDTLALNSDFIKGSIKGQITYISPEAEFTPMNIVTKEDRSKLVFAVKIKVLDHIDQIKAGMLISAAIN
jgi:HlyD family secretion protein